MKVTIYLIVIPTGQVDEDGVESVIIVDSKLTAMAAEQVVRRNPGSEIRKIVTPK